MSPRKLETTVLAAGYFLQQKIGRGVTDVSRWPPIHGLTTSSLKPATKPWALRLLIGASTIAGRFRFASVGKGLRRQTVNSDSGVPSVAAFR